MKESKEILEDDSKQKQEELKQKKEEEKELRKKQLEEEQIRRAKNAEKAREVSIKLGKKNTEWYLNPYYIVFGVLILVLVYVIVMLFLNKQPPLNKIPVIDDVKIMEHNGSSQWKQGPNTFFEGLTLADAKKLMINSFASHSNLNRCYVDESLVVPDSFDARKEWKHCKLPVQNQNKKCSGAYAVSVASAFSERLCIANKLNKPDKLSAQEILSCDVANKGCRGGYLNNALEYITAKGLSDEACLPYKGSSDVKCSDLCSNPKIKERPEGFCLLFGEQDIKKEIMKNGAVISSMDIYTDFLTYKSGVYTRGDDVPKFAGMHSIKIVGWGVEDGSESEPNQGAKYWIIENSWGEDWGINGYAKISVGQEFLFEQYAYSVITRAQNEELKRMMEQKAKEPAKNNANVHTINDKNKKEVPNMDLDDDVKDNKKNDKQKKQKK